MKKLEIAQMENVNGGSCTTAVLALVLTGTFTFLTGGAAIGLAVPAIGTALACLAER